jgi:translation initiation factor 2 beta subunit (eIF-2beta)/eIF-5
MAEFAEADKNDQEIKSSIFENREERCSSCESPDVETYIKNDYLFMVCHDCGGKQLLD